MIKLLQLLLAMVAAFIAVPALAVDKEPCGAGLICASKPDTVVSALQDAGYKGKMTKDDSGDPMVSSSASGYDFDVYFYGCKENKQCDSLQMRVSFAKDRANTTELANKWNKGKRFSQAYID